MKWLFAYDHKFYCKKDQFFSKQGFPYEMWQRYLMHCDELVVASRIHNLNENETLYSLSSGPKVSFLNVPNASNLSFFYHKSTARRTLIEEIQTVDAVIARVPSQIGFLAISIAKKLNKPCALEIVGDPKESYRYHGSYLAKLYAPLASQLMKKSVKTSLFSLYITEHVLQSNYPTSGFSSVCSNVDLINYGNENMVKRRKSRDLSENVIFGMIGSLDSDYKGLDIALGALAIIKSKIPMFEFRVLGSGQTDKWQSMVKMYQLEKNVKFCGTIPSSEVSGWLEAIDIYLQPSRTEGQGRSVIEAMATGCPVITSDVGGMKELAESQMRFPNGDEEKLGRIICKLLNSHDLYVSQIERNFNLAQRFNIEKLIRKRACHYKHFKDWIEED